jgi:hypothetical protein
VSDEVMGRRRTQIFPMIWHKKHQDPDVVEQVVDTTKTVLHGFVDYAWQTACDGCLFYHFNHPLLL